MRALHEMEACSGGYKECIWAVLDQGFWKYVVSVYVVSLFLFLLILRPREFRVTSRIQVDSIGEQDVHMDLQHPGPLQGTSTNMLSEPAQFHTIRYIQAPRLLRHTLPVLNGTVATSSQGRSRGRASQTQTLSSGANFYSDVVLRQVKSFYEPEPKRVLQGTATRAQYPAVRRTQSMDTQPNYLLPSTGTRSLSEGEQSLGVCASTFAPMPTYSRVNIGIKERRRHMPRPFAPTMRYSKHFAPRTLR